MKEYILPLFIHNESTVHMKCMYITFQTLFFSLEFNINFTLTSHVDLPWVSHIQWSKSLLLDGFSY